MIEQTLALNPTWQTYPMSRGFFPLHFSSSLNSLYDGYPNSAIMARDTFYGLLHYLKLYCTINPNLRYENGGIAVRQHDYTYPDGTRESYKINAETKKLDLENCEAIKKEKKNELNVKKGNLGFFETDFRLSCNLERKVDPIK